MDLWLFLFLSSHFFTFAGCGRTFAISGRNYLNNLDFCFSIGLHRQYPFYHCNGEFHRHRFQLFSFIFVVIKLLFVSISELLGFTLTWSDHTVFSLKVVSPVECLGTVLWYLLVPHTKLFRRAFYHPVHKKTVWC